MLQKFTTVLLVEKIQNAVISWGNSVIRKMRLSNGIGPLVGITFVLTPLGLGLYIYSDKWPCLIVALTPLLFLFYAFDYLMRKNPGLLRTEEHEEKMLRIAAGMGHKGHEISEEKVDQLPSVTSDEVRQIEDKRQ